MPRMKQPLSMKKLALQTVAQHIEMIAYGPAAKDAKSLRQINETETYLTFSGPFPFWRECFSSFFFSPRIVNTIEIF